MKKKLTREEWEKISEKEEAEEEKSLDELETEHRLKELGLKDNTEFIAYHWDKLPEQMKERLTSFGMSPEVKPEPIGLYETFDRFQEEFYCMIRFLKEREKESRYKIDVRRLGFKDDKEFILHYWDNVPADYRETLKLIGVFPKNKKRNKEEEEEKEQERTEKLCEKLADTKPTKERLKHAKHSFGLKRGRK